MATLLAIFPVFNAQFSFAADPPPQPSSRTSAPPDDNNSLPDLGKPVDTGNGKLNVNAGPGGVALEGRFERQRFSLTPEYSNQTGLSLGAGFASLLGDRAAIGLLVNVGADKKEWLINTGYRIDPRQRLILSGGQLRQALDYDFTSGKEKVGLTQNSGGLSYQNQLGSGLMRSFEFNGYIAKTASKDLTDKTFAIDTAALFELWNDPRRIAGGTVTGVQGRLGIAPIEGSQVKLSLGQEHLKYDVLVGKDSVSRMTGGIEWLQQLPHRYNLKLAADTFASQNRYSMGLERNLPGVGGDRHHLGLNLIGIRGRDGVGSDTQFQLTYTYTLGTGSRNGASALAAAQANSVPRHPMAQAERQSAAGQTASASDRGLLDQVATRPTYIPSHVVAKVDKTALSTRLIAIDKTSLPVGSTIDKATGDITTPLGVAVTGIASVTRNGGAFANTGQFAATGSSLIVRPRQIVQPAAGVTDTYVVTINNSGGGTTVATISVSHGSVRIDSIVISAGGDTTPPVTTVAPAISAAATDTTASVTQTINENGTGYYLVLPVASAAPTVAAVKAGTSFAMTGGVVATVNLTGLTASTAYKYYFVAKDAANNDQAAVSAGLAITTTAAGVDTTPPSTPATLVLTGSLGAAAGYTATQAITETVADVTDPSGVYWFVSESSSAPAAGDGGWSSTKPTSFTLSAGNGVKNVCVYVRDDAPTPNVQTTGKCATIEFNSSNVSVASDTVNMTVAGGTGTTTITYNTRINQAADITMKFVKDADASDAGGSVSVASISGDGKTVTFNYTAPGTAGAVKIRTSGKNAYGKTFTDLDSSVTTLVATPAVTSPLNQVVTAGVTATGSWTITGAATTTAITIADNGGDSYATTIGAVASIDAGLSYVANGGGSYTITFNQATTNFNFPAGFSHPTNQMRLSIDGGTTWYVITAN